MTEDEKKKAGLLGRVLTVFNKKRDDEDMEPDDLHDLAPEDEKKRVEYFIELNRKRLKAEKDKLFK